MRVKRILEKKARNQQNKFGKHGGGRPVRLAKPESENNEDDIRKQPRIRKQNQKTGKIKSENGCSKKSENKNQGPGTEGRPRSFHPSVFAHKVGGEGRPRCFHRSDLATNREAKEGRGPVTLGFGDKQEGRAPFTFCFAHKPEGSFHLSVLATNRVVKEGCAPFTPRFK